MSFPNVRVSNLKGENGANFYSDTTAHVGNWEAIQALTTAVAALVSDNISGSSLAAITIPAGAIIYGHFSSITLASGSVMAYKKI